MDDNRRRRMQAQETKFPKEWKTAQDWTDSATE